MNAFMHVLCILACSIFRRRRRRRRGGGRGGGEEEEEEISVYLIQTDANAD